MKHAWSEPNYVTPNRTERVCWKCALLKVTRHEPGAPIEHWREFERDGAVIAGIDDPTPPCPGEAPPAASRNDPAAARARADAARHAGPAAMALAEALSDPEALEA